MTKNRSTNAICILITILTLIVTAFFMAGESFGLVAAHSVPAYVNKLFSTDRVHTLDIVVDETDWQTMLEDASKEEYIACNVVINGELVKNVAIRPKGNSSLSSIANSDSDRYSFKIEFDHYVSGKTYGGLDKLALNNIAQDNTYLKDYVSYQMMNAFEADAPLSSFIYITVNGEDWGLYLAVEGVEESFAQRNYGSDYGELYKPDSMDMNAQDKNEGDAPQMPENGEIPGGTSTQQPTDGEQPANGERPDFGGGMPDRGEAASTSESGEASAQPQQGQRPQWSDGQMPENGLAGEQTQEFPGFNFPSQTGENADAGTMPNRGNGFGGMGNRNASDVALIYSDDEIDSYKNIFDGAKFKSTDADKERLIASIKQLNAGENIEEVVDTDEVLRYFVVHNFVLNFDSYTGNMMHNYYLYEDDGKLSMIAWDYNLAFGAFSMGGRGNTSGTNTATTMVNFPIDTPVSGVSMEDRPLLNQLLSNDTYLEQYHTLFSDFLENYFESGEFEKMFDNAVSLISPYVEKDPTAFCTYEEFTAAQTALKEFCLLRKDSIQGQLDGSIGSTTEAQAANNNSGFIDASAVDTTSMGSSASGFGNGGNRPGGRMPGNDQNQTTVSDSLAE